MNALQRFEDWLSRLLEGGLASLLGARIQPVDIAKRLAEYMEDHRTIGAGRRYVPNSYRVYLAPATQDGFASFQSALQEELASFLRARARERGLYFVGRVRVVLLAEESVRPEHIRIEADLMDQKGLVLQGPSQVTEAIKVAEAKIAVETDEPPRVPAVVYDDRHHHLADASRLTMGRALDNDVILNELTVSRHHARLVKRAGSWLLEDLGSTHGTFVNGRRVELGFLRPGDEIRLGAFTLRFEEVEEPPLE